MGLITSLYNPYVKEVNLSYKANTTLINTLMDEILITHSTLIADIEDKKVDSDFLKHEINKRVDQQKGIYNPEDVKTLLFNSIYGYGLLQSLIETDDISDIDAPHFDYFTVKKNGIITEVPIKFDSEEDFERYCKLLIIRHGGLINEVDNHCRVSDKKNKLRINVSIKPRNVSGASLSIRKHQVIDYDFQKLLELEFIDLKSFEIINDFNNQRKNILICGKGAAGKTTLLRAMINCGDEKERLLICESDTEIYPQKRNVISQYIKKQQNGGKVLTLSDLIREGLTMSLDTYCIGELVGGEAWDFIKAGYTDHRILGTLHARSAEDALNRILMLVENETRLSQQQLKEIISKSIQAIIYINAFKVVEIIKVNAFNRLSDLYDLESVYKRGV